MNYKVCKCGRIVWASDRYCECGMKYEDIDPEQFKRELANKHPHPYKDYMTKNYERATETEIDEWFRKWREKYNIP